ncbi:hypothetical protein QET40_11835 [Akkermansia sp. N21169]|uniref:hypothetical protein n=1 Tax=Akkermansia sp. N21169 TaxID=3040765 RepID=UPI00244E6C52|nr:hypothetical protein [Akkermansia sp. N21169]MDH3069792.1 hypothetical protein [Akkermansia sp. N21169]
MEHNIDSAFTGSDIVSQSSPSSSSSSSSSSSAPIEEGWPCDCDCDEEPTPDDYNNKKLQQHGKKLESVNE